jgi:hypothetical protein
MAAAAALLAAGLYAAAPAAAQQTDSPFLATYTGVSSNVGPDADGNLSVTAALSDPAASFGLTEALFTQTVFVFADPNRINGTAVFRMPGVSGGDALFAQYSGTGTPIDPAAGDFVSDISGLFAFTGGTGRFAGAYGGGSWFGQANIATGAVSVTFAGGVTNVPEPATWSLLLAGACPLLGRAVRRRRRTG